MLYKRLIGIGMLLACLDFSASSVAQPSRDACTNETLTPTLQISGCTILLEAAANYTDEERGIILYFRGGAYRRAKQFDKAFADQDQAAQLAPKRAAGRIGRGDIFIDQKEYTKALEEYEQALLLEPNILPAAVGSAQAAFELGYYDRVRKSFDHIIEIEPKNGHGWIGRCWIRAAIGSELEQVASDCERALELSGGSADAYDARGLLRLKQGDLAGAYIDYDTAIKKKPGTADHLFGRGIAEIRLGRTKKGEADIAKAEKIDPGISAFFARCGIAR